MAERQPVPQPETIRQNFTAEFSGFTDDQTRRVKTRMENFGLPLQNIEKVAYQPNDRGQEGLVGSYQPYTGEMVYYKSLEKLPAIAQDGVMLHETAHSSSPFEEKNIFLYGSVEAATKARAHTEAVAKQSLETNTYLNGYQAALAEKLKSQEIDERRFLEETFAILVELRFTNPKHLEQVQESLNKKTKDAVDINSGIDQALISLMPEINSQEQLDEHINKLRQQVVKTNKPILPNENLPLAA